MISTDTQPHPKPPAPALTEAQFAAAVPNARPQDVLALTAGLNAAILEAGIRTMRGVAMFLAQMSHESGSFRFREEHGSGAQYEGRANLGNTSPGDGPRYKGRGWVQLTGRANYSAAGEALGLNLEQHPELAATPQIAWSIAAWFWRTRGLSDVDSIEKVTRRLNGGTNGLDDRRMRYARACAALGVT